LPHEFETSKLSRASKENTTFLGRHSLLHLPGRWERRVQPPCLSYGILIAAQLAGARTLTRVEVRSKHDHWHYIQNAWSSPLFP